MGARLSKGRQPTTASLSPWTDLQLELMDLVLRCLPSHADRIRFAAVCRHWRYAATEYSLPRLPPALPWISFLGGVIESITLSYDDVGKRHFFAFREQAVCSGGSFDNWHLFREKECGGPDCHYYLRNPLSSAAVRLPGLCEEPVQPNPDGSHGVSSIARPSSDFKISKVIVCLNNLIAAIVLYPHYSGLRSVIVCCHPGMSSWSRGLINGHRWYMDMVFYNGKIYAVTCTGCLFAHEVVMNGGTTMCKPMVYQIDQVISMTQTQSNQFIKTSFYLVISHTGKLLMIRWVFSHRNRELVVKVFEADFETSQWLEVKSLDGQALFLSGNCSKAISASSDGGGYIKGNMIYFVDYNLIRLCLERSDKLACVYCMRSKKLDPISLGEDISDEADAAWFFP